MNEHDRQLEQLLESAQESLSPGRDLWPEVQQRINQPARQRRYRPYLAAAAVLLACLVFGWQLSRPTSYSSDPGLVALVESTRQTHIQQIEQLALQIKQVNWQTTPELQAIAAGSEQINLAEEQVYRELLKAPDNTSLWEMWLWLHRQEIELMLDSQQVSGEPQGVQI